jgi:hypothetical protein
MLSGKTLVILDEAIWGGMKKDKSSIKTLISEPRIPIRLMRTDAYEEDSFHFIMAFSNEKNFWPSEQGARREFLLECDNKYAGPQTPESKAYFDKIAAVDPAKFAWFLYNRDISKFNVAAVPITDLQREQAADNLDSVEAWLRSRMEEGDFYDENFGMPRTYKWNAWMTKDVMHRMYKDEMKGGHCTPLGHNKFFEQLTALIKYTSKRHGKKKVYGDQATDDMPDQIRGVQLVPKLEDFVKQWNKMRNDNVVTKKAEVIEMPADPPKEPSPLDEGVPAM